MNLRDVVDLNRAGTPKALPSFCTANDYVLDDIIEFAAANSLPVLIEATCNQVNQFGGYTGMKPLDYAANIQSKAQAAGLPQKRLILGGDHLGPNPWKHLPADVAMENAKLLVKDFVEAGFTKIHLDASMACGGEDTPSFELVAKRSAELCVVAEKHAPDKQSLSYVIGTEVPVPGGEADDMSGISVTSPSRLNETISTHQEAFEALGVSGAMDRVIAVVVQPGVDFSHDGIFHYDRGKAADLTAAISAFEGLAFEAHSTDYQTTENLSSLVADHSVILKVGPEITFRFREGVLALDQIEQLTGNPDKASVMETIRTMMAEDPSEWEKYYRGTQEEIAFLKVFSYSDRIRYYWDIPRVARALGSLMKNLETSRIPAAFASQYGTKFPIASDTIDPKSMISQRTNTTIERYYRAGGWI